MRTFAVLALCVAALETGAQTLTFDEALDLASARATPAGVPPFRAEIAALRRHRLPAVRAEVNANTSRTLDLFAQGPYESRYATSVLAFDYPIWDGGSTDARIDSLEARLERLAARDGLDDARFARLVESFGQLYAAQREMELIRPLHDEMAAEGSRSEALVASGEISNLTAIERGDAFLSLQSQLLDAEARRIDAATRLRLLTGLESEPVVSLELSSSRPGGNGLKDDLVDATRGAVDESRARLREIESSNGFRALLSGFAGFGTAQSSFGDLSSRGSFGIYGLRIHLSYPLFRGMNGLPLAEARADLRHNLAAHDAAVEAAKARSAEYRLREESATRRMEVLRRSMDAARLREESLQRLVDAGVRSVSDLSHAKADRTRREVTLLQAEVERWKAARLLEWMTAAAAGQP
jgi:outer membrane protein TolC